MSEIVSRPYNPDACCERCVFGSGMHPDWCPEKWAGDGNNNFLNRNLWIEANALMIREL